MHAIPAIGTKFQKPEPLVPSGQKNMQLNWKENKCCSPPNFPRCRAKRKKVSKPVFLIKFIPHGEIYQNTNGKWGEDM